MEVDYYKMAINWAEKYLEENKESKSFKIDVWVINDDLLFISTSLDRLKEGKGREKTASYNRIRKFKQFLEKK